jgi:protein-S-isoprenylcysteine O-methyltransferase Ste14
MRFEKGDCSLTWQAWFLLVYLVLFYGLAFFGRSWLAWRQTGINPYRLTARTGLHGYLARGYRLVFVAIALAVLLWVFVEPARLWMGPLAWLERQPVQIAGAALMAISLVWVLAAQAQMGASWRIGIDDENPTDLVARGIFARSRNPIFLGMRASLAGLFLMMPNAVVLACWLVGDVLIQVQVFLEEEHLERQHGDAYRRYRTATPRWLWQWTHA